VYLLSRLLPRGCVLTGVVILLLPLVNQAAIDAYPFPDDQMRVRYNALIAELRCPQCLNTNLAGSDAMIAKDLRREVHRLVLEGKTDEQVLSFMYERYGDFILYNPQLKPGTWLLWFGPVVFFIVALLILFKISRRRAGLGTAVMLSEQEQTRLNQLISSTQSDK
jgi:cytochrome c-type biogenesis protein CcmH